MPLDVVGEPGFVRGGVPFPRGTLRRGESVRLSDGSPLAAEALAFWGDGSVRWLLVEATASSRRLVLESGKGPSGPGIDAPTPDPGELTLVVDGDEIDLGSVRWSPERRSSLASRISARGETTSGLRWSVRLERTAASSGRRLRLEILNPTPTGQRHGQPTCNELESPGSIVLTQAVIRAAGESVRVRWGRECGATATERGALLLPRPMPLRCGERFGWEILVGEGAVEPALLEFPAAWGCDAEVFGPLVPAGGERFSEYELNSAVGRRGIRQNRNRPHWRNPREHGEDQRDWDGGDVERDFQTHNNEYDVHLGYAKQRVRTMGLGASSSEWHYLGVTGARHFANVDVYHVHRGPLRWMHGAQFQHVKHGGSGQQTRHRSEQAPNLAHTTGRGLLAWYYLTGDPLLLEAFLEMAENARWRVMRGPGGPGYSNTTGEERAPAGALGILTWAWEHTGDERYLEAAKKVVRESHAQTKPYLVDPDARDWRCKPWMIALLVVTLDEFVDAVREYGEPGDAVAARESAGLYKTFLRRTVTALSGLPQVPYQFSNDPERLKNEPTGSWNVVVADALVDFFPEVGEALLRSGSRAIWYPGHPSGTYAKLLNHTVLCGWGHRTMRAIVEQGS